jgi:Xaa-Pro aminopeptidase
VLIDLWAQEAGPPHPPGDGRGIDESPPSIYADITWVAYVGDAVPQRQQEVFDIVVGARDAAFKYLVDSFERQVPVQGWQADEVARGYIEERGYGDFFTHRLGHSINDQVHGDAVNLDGFETHDTRRIIPGIGFSIEPGIYLPEFGVRSEIDAFMSESGPLVTSPVQKEVVLVRRP